MALHWICPPIEVRLEDDGVQVDLNTGNTLAVPVPSGPPGRPGDPGPVGPGIPPGGSAGQYFRKASSTDYDGEWADLPDPPVPSVNGKTGPVELDADDVGALPDTTPLFSGDYDDLTNKPAIPTKVSDLTNDSGFVTALDIYPVGSIYMSVNSTSPATLFGGTWERIQDTFLLAAGTNHAAGSTGGEENHALTVNEMPTHHHEGLYWGTLSTPLCLNSGENPLRLSHTGSGADNGFWTGETGGGQAHNNMPPYLAVYVWKRTA